MAIAAALLLALALVGCSNDPGSADPKVPRKWSLAETGVTGNFTGVAYGKGVFVAATNKKEILWSADGITWETANPGYADLMSESNQYVYFFSDTFVLVDRGTSGDTGTSGNWAKSDDGKIWTDISGAVAIRAAGGGAFGNGKAVIGMSGSNVCVSGDFSTWTQKATGVAEGDTTINWVNSVAYGNGKFVIGGQNGLMAHSGDAESWTKVTWDTDNVFGADYINQIVFGEGSGLFMAVGGNPSVAATSSDGTTWKQTGDIKLNTTSDSPHVGYGTGVFIATWNGLASYTTDAYNWTLIEDTKFGDSAINAIAYGAGKFVMVGGNGKIAYSTPE
jgi:hypothetical protein